MDLRIDDKGKFFTPRVSKDMLPSFIRTASQVVVGNIHVRPERRLKDELNDDSSRYLPVTDAYIYDAATEQMLYHSSFLLLSYQQIVMISPLDALENIRDVPWQHPMSEQETQ